MIQVSADMGLKACVGVFLLSCLFLATTYDTTFAFDRPVHTAVFACVLTGSALLILARLAPSVCRMPSPMRKPSVAPLADQFELPSRNNTPSSLSRSNTPSPLLGSRENWAPPSRFGPLTRLEPRIVKVGLLAGVCCVRIETFRRITLNTECAPAGYAYVVPFVIALYDYWRHQRSRQVEEYVPSDRPRTLPSQPVFSFCRRTFYILTESRLRGIIAAAFLSMGGYLAASLPAGKQSTYICPAIFIEASVLQTYKLLNVVLDSILLVGTAELFWGGARNQEAQRKRNLVLLGAGLFGVALVSTVIGIFVQNNRPEHSGQLFLDVHYSRSALGQALLVVLLILSAWQLLPHYGILGLSILAGFVFLYFSVVSTFAMEAAPFPFISRSHAILTLLASLTGAVLFLLTKVVPEEEPKTLFRTNILLQVLFICLCGVGLVFAVGKHRVAHLHPIDLLIYNGRINHDNFLAQAQGSQSLDDAVVEYRRRYGRQPPPGFDKWYEYAVKRSSVVMDDFDQIHDSLLPFWALHPDEIRGMTHQLATNSFNDLGAISIRNGKARVQEGIQPTHAWMVLGAIKMIEKFSEHLPDMDLVLNLNDEPRVAVPWEKMRVLKYKAHHLKPVPEARALNVWSKDRWQGWGSIEPAHQTNETIFTDGAWRGVFDPYVSAICPPSSKARTQRIWDRHDVCMSCVAPHSMGQFPLSFDLASDFCHQPDLAFLHGLLISPASFKVSQELVPVFSQSALSGFSDILFPSPWNYMDKIRYRPSPKHPDPDYSNKQNSLFWIGSTSEGMSRFSEWKGMPRQRFSHLINNNTHSHVSVLLPATEEDTYRYEIMSGTAPSTQLSLRANVHLAGPISRCGDCEMQFAELGAVHRVDFQEHWSHRFLFDLDGAGFSGRFIPFLQSHSLPLRTGLFRQWFDSRVTSWLHFVPVDIRLHGLWSTLAYFAGVPGSKAADLDLDEMRMKANTKQGHWIAEEGRKWAQQALRKEDMEVYFFRLLLEWGRLTDDQRDVLGYKP